MCGSIAASMVFRRGFAKGDYLPEIRNMQTRDRRLVNKCLIEIFDYFPVALRVLEIQ